MGVLEPLKRAPLRAWVLSALAGALAAWVWPVVGNRWNHFGFGSGIDPCFQHPMPTVVELAKYTLAELNFGWGYVGLAMAIAARHLLPRHAPRAWAAVAIVASGLAIAASLWWSLGVWHDEYWVHYEFTPSLLGFAVGAALFALPGDGAPGRARPLQWVNLPARALAIVVLIGGALLHAHRVEAVRELVRWDYSHGLFRYPLSLLLMLGYTALALVAVASKRRALLGVITLALGCYVLYRWVPWQLLHWLRFAGALLLADALRTRSEASEPFAKSPFQKAAVLPEISA